MEQGHFISSSTLEPLLVLLLWDDVIGIIFFCQIRKLYWNNEHEKANLTVNSACALHFL